MADIETQHESNALQAAADQAGHNGTSEERWAFRHGWIAGREYERQQQAQAEAQRLVMRGMRLIGCPHTRSCTSVDECAARSRGQ